VFPVVHLRLAGRHLEQAPVLNMCRKIKLHIATSSRECTPGYANSHAK
jgi:hypothetical protein